MALDPNQPSRNRLREILVPWFDHVSGWLVLLCFALAAAGPWIARSLPIPDPELAGHAVLAAAVLAAGFVCWRTSSLTDLRVSRRNAWSWIAFALVAELASIVAGADALQFLFLALAAFAAGAMLVSTRDQSFGAQFWLESLIVSLCIGAVLWLSLPAQAPWQSLLDASLVVFAATLLLRRSSWQGWPGLVTFALALIALAGARLLTAAAATGMERLQLAAIAAFALAAQLDYLRTARRVPPMDAAERGSPFAPLTPYAALMLAGYALLVLHSASFEEPAGLFAWVVCVSAVLLFARQALATGVADAVQTGLARRSAEARFTALIRNTSDVIGIANADGVFTYLTPTAERIFGQTAVDLIGRKIAELVAFEDRARLRDFFARDLTEPGASANVEARVPRGDDKHRVVEIHGTNMEKEPAIGGFLLNLRDMTDRRGMEEQLKRLALHDPLTLLANRSLFRDRLEHAIAVSKRNGRGVAVLFVDLDNFKKINDSLGHATGDRVLHKSAQRLVKATRNGDTVARFGGDEFAVLLENLTDKDQVVEIAGRIIESLQESLELPGNDMRVAASIGVAFATPDDGVEELMRNADVAMYSSKAQGKGRYTIYEASLNRAASQRQEMEVELARALKEGQFLIHYQPIVELKSSYLLGVEALVRWQHPKRGLIAPSDFIPVAEESGQIVTLGRWVLAQACREVRVWQARLPEGRQVRVAVNVSAVQLSQSDIHADVKQALELSSIDPGCVVIELTESVLMQNSEEVLAKLTRLKKLGVRIAIDDFGTGLSSLTYLHRFPIDILKIDRSFVENLGRLEDGSGLVRAIIKLGETLGLEVVAEGIELEQQQRGLVELGCVAGQGFYYSKPAMLHELEHSIHMMRRRTMADTLPQGAKFTATGRFIAGDLKPSDLGFVATGTFGREMLKKNQ